MGQRSGIFRYTSLRSLSCEAFHKICRQSGSEDHVLEAPKTIAFREMRSLISRGIEYRWSGKFADKREKEMLLMRQEGLPRSVAIFLQVCRRFNGVFRVWNDLSLSV